MCAAAFPDHLQTTEGLRKGACGEVAGAVQYIHARLTALEQLAVVESGCCIASHAYTIPTLTAYVNGREVGAAVRVHMQAH